MCTYHGANDFEREAGRKRKAAAKLSRDLFVVDAPPVRDVIASALRLAGKLEALADRAGDRLNGDSLSPEDRAFFTTVTGQLGPLLTRLAALRLGERELELAREQLQLVRVGIGRSADAGRRELEERLAGALAEVFDAGPADVERVVGLVWPAVRVTLLRVFAAELRTSGPLEIEGSDV